MKTNTFIATGALFGKELDARTICERRGRPELREYWRAKVDIFWLQAGMAG